MALLRMRNVIQHYAWGSPTALPRLLGMSNPGEEPIAEIWMGAHPKAPSTVLLPEGELSLDEAVREDPDRWIGPAGSARFGGEFPFLLKLLSAERALSIQAHPSKRQAEEGYAREERLGIPLDAPHRNYRDRNHKPELMLPLTEFFGLSGFRTPREVEENLGPYLESLGPPADALPRPGREGLEAWFKGWMGLSERSRQLLLDRVLADVPEKEELDSPLWWVGELNREYPGDFGALSPLFLNLLHLKPGEGIFMGPGVLHAYLRGTGVEIMANSDNVLRSGCTEKHVDPEELVNVLAFEAGGVERIEPIAIEPGEELYRTPADEFEIVRLSLDEETREVRRTVTNRAPLVLLSTAGRPTVRSESPFAERLLPGDSLFVTPGTATVEVTGPGIVYCATIAGAID
ncbi:MAG: mannose-6-phosphate isomerase, class I [Spirochaetaceae bacterium]